MKEQTGKQEVNTTFCSPICSKLLLERIYMFINKEGLKNNLSGGR